MVINVHSNASTVMMYGLGDDANVHGYTAARSLEANGHLRGWLARKDGQIEWFPARKQRAKKRPAKKRNTKN
jgi:hypothetical protein